MTEAWPWSHFVESKAGYKVFSPTSEWRRWFVSGRAKDIPRVMEAYSQAKAQIAKAPGSLQRFIADIEGTIKSPAKLRTKIELGISAGYYGLERTKMPFYPIPSKKELKAQLAKKKLFRLIVENKLHKVRPLILKAVKLIESGDIDMKLLAIPSGWKKDYQTDVPQVRAPKYSNECLDKNYVRGDTFWIYMGHIEGMPSTDVVALDWDDDPEAYGIVIDIPENVRRHVVLPTEPILEALGLSMEEILTGMKKMTLNDYMDTDGWKK
jgi:hypothetical protein